MFPFVESIKYINKKYYNLEYHQQRLDATRAVHFPNVAPISLKDKLNPLENLLPDQLYKCRVLYGETIGEVSFEPYTPRSINQFYMVVCPDDLDYTYKYANRTFFDNARAKLKNDEDFIYIRKGMITDSSFANLVFSDGVQYYTPANPLLKGTKRAFYIEQEIIKPEELKVSDIRLFKRFFTINAMLDLDESLTFSCDKLLLSNIYLRL